MKFLGHIDEEKDIINLGEVGVAYMVILAPENFGFPEDVVAQAKAHNKVVFDAYAAAPEDAKPILYLSGSNRNTPLEVGTTIVGESGQLASLDLSQKAVISMDAYKGEASVFLSATLYPDGSIALNSNNELGVEMVQLATTDYVDDVAGKAYPVYTPSDGQELTEEQKAVNKEAYDALAASYGGSQVPHLYLYEIGKMFPIIPYDVYADEGYAELFLNINMMQSPLSDFGLSGYGLLTLGEHFYLHSDGSVTADSSSVFISPDIMTMYELANAKNVETRWLHVSKADGSITAAQQNYNKETYSKIASGKIIQLALLLIAVPVEHSYVDGVVRFSFQSLGGNGVVFHGQGVLNSDGSYVYEEYALTGGSSDDTITETDPVFSASAAAGITAANIAAWNNKVDKVSGKGLSSNDYTTTEKDKLAGIAEGAEVNVQSDWNATSGDAFIKNKPTIPAAVTESTVSGWGFTKNTGTYSKPSTGIPKSDLASSVQTSLGKADTALQSYTEQYKGTVTGVKVNGTTKSPSSGTVDIGNVVTSIKINGSSKTPSSGVVDLGTIPTTIDSSMSDTSTNPVQNKTIKAYVDSKAATAGQMPTLAHGSSETSVEITPNVYHRWSSTMSSLTITLQSVSSAYVLNYMFEFKASSSGCVLTLPTNIKWANGNPPAIKPSATYQISIVNNLGVWTYYE